LVLVESQALLLLVVVEKIVTFIQHQQVFRLRLIFVQVVAAVAEVDQIVLLSMVLQGFLVHLVVDLVAAVEKIMEEWEQEDLDLLPEDIREEQQLHHLLPLVGVGVPVV
jgi:hypothetical protein